MTAVTAVTAGAKSKRRKAKEPVTISPEALATGRVCCKIVGGQACASSVLADQCRVLGFWDPPMSVPTLREAT